MPKPPKNPAIIKPDKDAAEIGDLYRKARLSLVESVRFAIACGQRLKAKQDSLHHGEWLPWLESNAETLGFETRRTAARLMSLASNGACTSHLDEAAAITYSRQLWGNSDDDADEANDRDDIDLDSLLRGDDGKLTPRAREFVREVRAEKTAAKKAIRDAREIALAGKILALPNKKYGVILADRAKTDANVTAKPASRIVTVETPSRTIPLSTPFARLPDRTIPLAPAESAAPDVPFADRIWEACNAAWELLQKPDNWPELKSAAAQKRRDKALDEFRNAWVELHDIAKKATPKPAKAAENPIKAAADRAEAKRPAPINKSIKAAADRAEAEIATEASRAKRWMDQADDFPDLPSALDRRKLH